MTGVTPNHEKCFRPQLNSAMIGLASHRPMASFVDGVPYPEMKLARTALRTPNCYSPPSRGYVRKRNCFLSLLSAGAAASRRSLMDTLLVHCAGLDVHKDNVVACVRHQPSHGRARSEVRTFSTLTAGLLALADWLNQEGVTHVAMESTGVYWKPVYHI